MARSVNKVASRNRRKKVIKQAKGYYGRRKSTIRAAHDAVMHAKQDAYIGRKLKKRDFRQLWIIRISAAVRTFGVSYSKFMNALKKAGVLLNRKALSEMTIHNKEAFKDLVTQVTK